MSSSTSSSDSRRGLRRLVAGAAAGFAGAAALWVALAWAQTGSPSETSRWTHEVREIKKAAARAVRGPKAVLIGGSSVNFGLSAGILARELGMPAVNLGVHAGLMLDNLLVHAQDVLGSGDLAVLALEYVLYAEDGELDWNLVDYVFAYDPEYLGRVSLGERARLYLSLWPARIAGGLIGKLRPEAKNPFGYQATSIRPEDGDETRNARTEMTELDWQKNAGQVPVGYFTGRFDVSPGSEARLRAFADWCRERGVRAVVAFPPTIYHAGLDEALIRENSDRLIAALRRAGLDSLGRPEDFRYERELFYDTAWHMNDVGRDKHSRYVARLLREKLGGTVSP